MHTTHRCSALKPGALSTQCILAALVLTLACPIPIGDAAFVGVQVENMTSNSLGLSEFALFAVFDDGGDVLVNVFNSNIATNTGFFHNSINGGQQSALPFTSAQSAVSDQPDADSFVTIGLMTGDDNQTILDPFFDVDHFLIGNGLGTNAGWFNINVFNGQGIPDEQGRVPIAVFTPLNDAEGNPGIVSGTLEVGYGDVNGDAQYGIASFITPAPGALGLFALAGLTGRSRRRRDRRSGPRRVGDGEVQPPLLRPRWK